jgi:lariat debranching enzyme
MYFGGFASDKIFYMGAVGVCNISGLRIAGLSGIYKDRDFDRPIFESPPYSEDTKRSAYHVRRHDIEKLLLLRDPVDIVVSHDWPTGITDYGDTESMLRKKDRTGQLRRELSSGDFGNPYQMELLKKLKPRFWFSGHMHVKYPAIYTHSDGSITRFLALDKCIPHRPFLQFVGVDSGSKDLGVVRNSGGCESPEVCFDEEWLSILKVNNRLLPVGRSAKFTSGSLVYPSDSERDQVRRLLSEKAELTSSGMYTFPYFGQVSPGDHRYRTFICDLLEMPDRLSESDQLTIPKHVEPPAGDALFYLD